MEVIINLQNPAYVILILAAIILLKYNVVNIWLPEWPDDLTINNTDDGISNNPVNESQLLKEIQTWLLNPFNQTPGP